MKKKLFCLILILILTFCFTGCSKTTYEDFIYGFEEYLQESFPEDDISIKCEEEDFWIYFGSEKAPIMLTLLFDGESILEDDERMNEEAKSIHLTGSFLEYDSAQSAKIFGGFLDYLSKDIDNAMNGAKEVSNMIEEYSTNQKAERKVDRGRVDFLPLDLDNAIISIVFSSN